MALLRTKSRYGKGGGGRRDLCSDVSATGIEPSGDTKTSDIIKKYLNKDINTYTISGYLNAKIVVDPEKAGK